MRIHDVFTEMQLKSTQEKRIYYSPRPRFKYPIIETRVEFLKDNMNQLTEKWRVRTNVSLSPTVLHRNVKNTKEL